MNMEFFIMFLPYYILFTAIGFIVVERLLIYSHILHPKRSRAPVFSYEEHKYTLQAALTHYWTDQRIAMRCATALQQLFLHVYDFLCRQAQWLPKPAARTHVQATV